MKLFARIALGASLAAAFASPALADVRVGLVLSLTGPAASLGIPEKKTLDLLPRQIAGQKIDYMVLDDRSDPTEAVKATRELIDADKVALVIGASTTPSSLAMVDVVGQAKVPNISLASGKSVVFPVQGNREYVFNSVQTTALMAHSTARYMVAHGVHKVAFIGFSNALGEDWLQNFSTEARSAGIDIVDVERFAPAATSVTGEVLHVLAAHPQAVLIAASGTPAALPERELRKVGYQGQIYQTHGVANPDFLRVCGADCNGTILSVSPGVVAGQLPASAPIKASAMAYANAYQGAYGKNTLSQFSVGAWDAGVMLEHALPVALRHARPDDLPALRAALRNALEGLHDLRGAQGVYDMSPSNHNGLDDRAVAVAQIRDGEWKLLRYGQ